MVDNTLSHKVFSGQPFMQRNYFGQQCRLSSIALLAAILLLSGCGGGGSSPTPVLPPSFQITVNPSSVSLSPGTSVIANVSLQPENGFSGTATVTLSGLPSGLTVSPASPFPLTAAGQALTFTASNSAANGTYSLSFQATSGTLTASTTASLAIALPAPFSVTPSDSSLTVRYGSSVSTTINFSPGTGATNYTLALSALGLPSAVTFTYSPVPASPTSFATVTFTASSSGQASLSAQVTLVATRSLDGLQKQAPISLQVSLPPGQLPSSRTEFIRTDDIPSSIVYDPVHDHAFVCNPHLSRVDVISPSSRSVVKSIAIPGAKGLSLTPDNSRVFVSGAMQQVAWIDTASLAIVKQTTLPMDQPSCLCDPQFASVPLAAVTSSGRVLFLGSTPFYFGALDWDPVAGTLVERPDANVGQGGLMARSGDGTKIILSDGSTGGVVTIYDAASDSFPTTRRFNDFAFSLAADPDGTRFAVAVAGQGIYILDSNLNTVGIAPAGGFITGMVYSPDGQYLYVVSEPYGLPIISTIDAQTLGLIGTAPAYATSQAYVVRNPPLFIETPMAADNHGTVFGSADHGVALDDATFTHSFNSASVAPIYVIVADPAEGQTAASTQVQISTQSFDALPDIWFGELLGVNASLNPAGQAQVTAPPAASPGPVNIRVFNPDSTAAFMPQGFTYGVSPVTYGNFAAAPVGGVAADLFGYGFGVDATGGGPQVQVGGNVATITKAALYPAEQGAGNGGGYPFPLQHLQVTIPPGSAGARDISITSPSGTATVSKGFHYFAALGDYATPDTLLDVLYDQGRQQLYLSAGDHVDVFSLNTNTFLAPIKPPTLGGTYQLEGIALTPDGAKLLVANLRDNTVAIISPDNPSAAIAVSIAPPGVNPCAGPTYVVTTSLNTAFIGCTNGGPGTNAALYQLNLATLQSTIEPAYVSGNGVGGNVLSASKDGSKVFVSADGSNGGPTAAWNAAQASWTTHELFGFIHDSAVAGDGNVFSTVGAIDTNSQPLRFLDPQTNILGAAGVPEFLQTGTIRGERLHDTGSLDYFPFPQGIDIFDVRHATLRERVLLSEQIMTGTIHPMAPDETGQRIFLITNRGLTVVRLDAVPLSIGNVTPASGPSGAVVTVRGSGFIQGATASVNGAPASVSYLDADTLQLSLPSLPPGAVQITVTNPDGESYSLDNAFTVQ